MMDSSNSYATGAVSASVLLSIVDGYASVGGGLVGIIFSGLIRNSYATGTVSSSSHSYINGGGLVGSHHSVGTISNSYATGAVSVTCSDSDCNI